MSLVLLMCTFALSSFRMVPQTEASASTVVYVDPPKIVDPTLGPGSTFTVNIKIADAYDVVSWSFVLFWEPAILNVSDVVEGPFLKSAATQGTFFIKKINQTEGYIDVACGILGFEFGVSGSGILASVTFLVEGTGETPLDLRNTLLYDHYVMPIAHEAIDGYFANLAISIYIDKYSYSAGDIMHLGLTVINPLDRTITVCIVIWLEKPDGSKTLILHVHAKTLPAGFRYNNPDFKMFELPSIPSGVYTWHAAFLNPTTHKILLEDTAEWEFV